ncbi:hypothetical protein A2U01_0036648 [Trifolium medium]|uniref:Uncharacterized protein n=1 Tax=Trifolium medium TaxID=97028 RepID=A0A392PVN1_9FABA|nr:hypothetical protein [Trifolium medium]
MPPSSHPLWGCFQKTPFLLLWTTHGRGQYSVERCRNSCNSCGAKNHQASELLIGPGRCKTVVGLFISVRYFVGSSHDPDSSRRDLAQ